MTYLIKQKAIFSDIIQGKWQNSLTGDQVRFHLGQTGFKAIEVVYSSQGIDPTVVATR